MRGTCGALRSLTKGWISGSRRGACKLNRWTPKTSQNNNMGFEANECSLEDRLTIKLVCCFISFRLASWGIWLPTMLFWPPMRRLEKLEVSFKSLGIVQQMHLNTLPYFALLVFWRKRKTSQVTVSFVAIAVKWIMFVKRMWHLARRWVVTKFWRSWPDSRFLFFLLIACERFVDLTWFDPMFARKRIQPPWIYERRLSSDNPPSKWKTWLDPRRRWTIGEPLWVPCCGSPLQVFRLMRPGKHNNGSKSKRLGTRVFVDCSIHQ